MASPMRERHANRRIRLLLAIFALVFAAMLARAAWLQGVQAAHLSALAKSQHEETQTIPAGRGTIFDRTGVQLALGEQTTTVFADPYLVRNARAIAVAAHDVFGVDPNTLLPELHEQEEQVRVREALRRPEDRRAVPEEGLPRRRVVPRGAADIPTGRRGRAGAWLCGDRRPRARWARAAVRPQARRPRRQADNRPRSDRANDRRDQLTARLARGRRLHDARPHDPGAGRKGAA